jgi:tRNA-guanine transglycosylase
MDFDGIAIGGVSVGESKKEMKKVLDWVTPLLPEEKPRHLLGVGEIDDIFTMIERGIDTFDCVQPTRLARMGNLYVKHRHVDITKARYAADFGPIESGCTCYTCSNFTRAYIHHLFHVKELLGYRLATIHNLYFIHRLVNDIRGAIEQNQFLELKKKWL